jgi:hypothetical protein
LRFCRVVEGRRKQLAGTSVKVAGNTWHTLALWVEGERFAISFDERELYSAQDTLPQAGKIALWTKADSITYFDSLLIRPFPEDQSR